MSEVREGRWVSEVREVRVVVVVQREWNLESGS